MVTSIPTFRLKVSEGIIEGDTSADRLFGYCVEANKGPINQPTFVSSNQEAKNKFGIDFAPHFAQNPTGLIICRVGYAGASTAFYEYKMYPEGETTTGEGDNAVTTKTGEPDTNGEAKAVLQIAAVSPGKCDIQVIIRKATSGHGYDLQVIIKEESIANQINPVVEKIGTLTCPKADIDPTIIDKKYSNLRTLRHVARKINTVFGDWLIAKMCSDFDESKGPEWYDVYENGSETTSNMGKLEGGSNGYMRDADGNVTEIDVDDPQNGLYGTNTTEEVKKVTQEKAYNAAFEEIQKVDSIGIALMTEDEYVQSLLAQHIEHVIDPEIHQLRFGIVGYPKYAAKENDTTNPVTLEDLKIYAQTYDSPWMIYIGQGVIFTENGVKRKVYPHQAVQLYTGIRSSLGYAEAIFGGEEKKILRHVTDTLPLVTDGRDLTRDDIVDLNQTGVCTFKKEYGEVTFLEGVTTVQDDDVLSYENMMSIVANVTRRLIRICKPYQGQLLTEDLKSTLQTALSQELSDITSNEGTLMALEDFNIPPYDVQIYSAGKTRYDETHKLIRENKIIVQCRIVPVGALRDIDLGVIVI